MFWSVWSRFSLWFPIPPVVLYPEWRGDNNTHLLKYKFLYYEISKSLCVRERRTNRKPLRFILRWVTYPEILASSSFFYRWLIQSSLTIWEPSGPTPSWHSDNVTSTLLTADFDCPLGLKTSVVIYFLDAHTYFTGNSRGISAVPCSP